MVTEEHGSEMRYSLLETIRQYAREKLLDSGVEEVKQVRIRHLDFFVRLAEVSIPRLQGPEMIECLDELELEQDNLRAAVEWAIENDPVSALRMALLLPGFWGRRLSAIRRLRVGEDCPGSRRSQYSSRRRSSPTLPRSQSKGSDGPGRYGLFSWAIMALPGQRLSPALT